MAPLEQHLIFGAWKRSSLFDAAIPGARLTGELSLRMSDEATGAFVDEKAQFTFLAAADIAAVETSAIRHLAPAPSTFDAETTKYVHVDFHEKDFPWRYTPNLGNGNQLFPWLVLLTGAASEIEVTGQTANILNENAVLLPHDLRKSYLWAHTQNDGKVEISRLISVRELPPQQECIAVLVPAFNAAGKHMWSVVDTDGNGVPDAVVRDPATPSLLPALYSWRFWTAEAGDFETLAAALRIPEAGLMGVSSLRYRRDIAGMPEPVKEVLQIRGAITSLKAPPAQPEAIEKVREDLDRLNDDLEGEHQLSMPHYGRPWVADPDAVPIGWPSELHDDPRYRGIAGLGAMMGVEAQDALMDAAVQQVGALREAGQHINHLALGLEAAGGLWERRLADNQNEQLRVLGSMMDRILASDGGTALDRVTSGTSPFPPAFFSSAAQRILRGRSAHTRHLAGEDGRLDITAVTDAVNQPDAPAELMPDGLPHFNRITEALGQPSLEELFGIDDALIEDVMTRLRKIAGTWVQDYRRQRDDLLQAGQPEEIPPLRQSMAEGFQAEFLEAVDQHLGDVGIDTCNSSVMMEWITRGFGGSFQEFFERVLEDDLTLARLLDEFSCELRFCHGATRCVELTEPIEGEGPPFDCRELICSSPTRPPSLHNPINLGSLVDGLIGFLDPREPDAPARVRVCSRLSGVDCSRLVPPEYPIGLDFPTWDLLRRHEKEWLLPGASSVPKDSIIALQTNPAFVDAFMVGINTQFMSEMRWRDLAVERMCTPLRMFWGQIDYGSHKREADIEPIREWAKNVTEPIGALAHQTIKPHSGSGNTTGSRLVIAFRTDLFRRYPATLVYLIKPQPGLSETQLNALLTRTPDLDMPDSAGAGEAAIEVWRATRTYFGPTFAGTITPDLTFFAFDVNPESLDQYWLILDEPPAELRFRNDQSEPNSHSAAFAEATIDKPTRVAISGLELRQQGLAV
jgi:hypothetical protein